MKSEEKQNFLEKEADRLSKSTKVDDGADIVGKLENMFTKSEKEIKDEKPLSLGELELTLEEKEALKKSQSGGSDEANNNIYTQEQINQMCNEAEQTKQVSQAILSIIDKCKF